MKAGPLRRTKIVATLGPATEETGRLRALLEAGVDVVRLNFSHGSAEDHRRRAGLVRAVADELGQDIAILGDLQGPKIRIEGFGSGRVELEEGQEFVLDARLGPGDGDSGRVGLGYKHLPHDVDVGSLLLLDDGKIELEVESVDGTAVRTRVVTGGPLSDNKGINLKGGGLSAPALTDKDRSDIRTAAAMGVDYLAVSFPRDADDIETARRLFREAGGNGRIVAKIERTEAIENIEAIVRASDVIMVARGDLGVEMGYSAVPGLQKRILKLTRRENRVSIIATQMMESMIHNAVPTRAEVSDVANAVLDGTDAVMLSAETAIGEHPLEAVDAMAEACLGAEHHQSALRAYQPQVDDDFQNIDQAIAMAVMYTANHLSVKAIIALTESGSTTLWMSRIRSDIPIYAFTPHDATSRRVTLYRGVYPVSFKIEHSDVQLLYRDIFTTLLSNRLVDDGDLVIFTKGDLSGVSGSTNSMKIIRVNSSI
jgi:pyruvate kinase